ncbi:DUF1697 domain-containing protein [Nocardioides campestrisoli]|uniref:DUF1697 domain-containing protein n=1 Tax=Nocardioides campestrisoli TaxID=2736757 RepID=UPI0015E6D89D|nr:DUF1697 domain-containing protein [Nocardioides campestrisoli]
MQYVVLLRGINVGGRNKVAMPALRDHLGEHFGAVRSYIQSGNVLLESDRSAAQVAAHIEQSLPTAFALDSALVRVLVLDEDAYRYDVGFYLGATRDEVEPHLVANPEVDEVVCGDLAFYHRRVIALASRSWLTRIIGKPVYGSLTLRNWRTTTTLHGMLDAPA